MRRALELLMYLAFSLAALPFAWLGVRNILYFRAHPEMLEVRDSALELFGVVAVVPFMGACLLVAAGLALCVLWIGPRAARINSSILVVAWVALFFSPETEFRSFARLYWEGLPFAALVVLPWICAGVRLGFRTKRPTPLKITASLLLPMFVAGSRNAQATPLTPVPDDPHHHVVAVHQPPWSTELA